MAFQQMLSIAAVGLLVSFAATVEGQQPIVVGSELDDYVRLLEITGRLGGAPLVFRPLAARHVGSTLRADSSHPWESRYPLRNGVARSRVAVTWLDPVAHTVYQSAYPRDVNDGALWAGKGTSAQLSAGARAILGPFTATLYPTVYSTTNADFPIQPGARSTYAYPWTPFIDWPQRFGADAVTEFDWGQSSLRLDLAGFTAGAGTENMWWGPAQRHPILMSNSAPGFPHLDLGTGRPVRTPIGKVEARLVWGQLSESPYYDTVSTNQHRFLTALTAAIEPKWVPGLTLGLARVFFMPWDSVDAEDVVVTFQTVFKRAFESQANPEGNDDRDQMLSLFGRWVLPESGFDLYTEWTRNDHNLDLRDFILEPEHSQAFMLGFSKAGTAGAALWRVRGEITHLERSRTFAIRGSPVYYTHHLVQQGYTHRGQLLGAAIGPGASSQFLGLDWYTDAGRIGGYVERVRYNNDVYYEQFAPTDVFFGHDVELTAGISALRFFGVFDLRGALAVSRELNRYFQVNNDVTNVRAELSLRWRIP